MELTFLSIATGTVAIASTVQAVPALASLVYLTSSKQQGRFDDDLEGVVIPHEQIDVVVPVREPLGNIEPAVAHLTDSSSHGARLVLLHSRDDVSDEWTLEPRPWGIYAYGQPPAGFKAGVLNMWIARTTADYVVVLDIDSHFDRSSLERLVRPLIVDPTIAFVQGNSDYGNRDDAWISASDAASLRLHHDFEQQIRSDAGIPINMNGYMMALRTSAVLDHGGFDDTQLSEDVDLACRLARTGNRGIHLRGVRGSADLTTSLTGYRHQKVRWIAGRLQALRRHGVMELRQGSVLGRLLNLNFLLEYATPVSAVPLLLLASCTALPWQIRAVALIMAITPGVTRLAATARAASASRGNRSPSALALGDAALRWMLHSTELILAAMVALGRNPGWRWSEGRRWMLRVNTAWILTAVLIAHLSEQNDIWSSTAQLVLLSMGLGGFVLWATSDENVAVGKRREIPVEAADVHG